MILRHNLHMFLDIQKLKTFDKNSRLDKTAVKMWCQILQKKTVFGIGFLCTKKS